MKVTKLFVIEFVIQCPNTHPFTSTHFLPTIATASLLPSPLHTSMADILLPLSFCQSFTCFFPFPAKHMVCNDYWRGITHITLTPVSTQFLSAYLSETGFNLFWGGGGRRYGPHVLGRSWTGSYVMLRIELGSVVCKASAIIPIISGCRLQIWH